MFRFSLFFLILTFLSFVLITTEAQGILVPDIENNKGFIDDFFSEASELAALSDRGRAQKLIEANHATPRYTFFTSDLKLTRVPARFCLPNLPSSSSSEGDENATDPDTGSSDNTYDIDDCEWKEYAESLLLISFVTFLVAVIIFPFLFCGLGLGRCCCCGMYSPTTEICCGNPKAFEATTSGYTPCSIMVLFVLSIACCVVLVAASAVGMVGSLEMTNNVYIAANFTNQTAHKFVDILDSVIDVFMTISETEGEFSDVISMDTLESASSAGNKLANATSTIAEYSDLIDLPRRVIMYITLFLPLGLMLLVVLSRFCNCWCLSWGMAALGFIITSLALCIFGVLLPAASGISDLCVFLDDALENPENDTFIKSFFQCTEGSPLSTFSETAEKIMQKAGNLTCNLTRTLDLIRVPCDADKDGIIDLSNPLSDDNYCRLFKFSGSIPECNYQTFETVLKSATMYDLGLACFQSTTIPSKYVMSGACEAAHSRNETSICPDVPGKEKQLFYCLRNKTLSQLAVSVSQCSENCTDYDLRSNASDIVRYIDAASKTFEIYNNKIKPYINCESLIDITTRAKDFVCVNVINSVTPMYAGEIMAAVASFVGTFVALLSVKRFRRKFQLLYSISSQSSEGVGLISA